MSGFSLIGSHRRVLKQFRWGRFQLKLIVWQHVYGVAPDRWVIQPSLIYDRKRK